MNPFATCTKNGIATLGCITPLFQRAVGIAVGLVGTVTLFLIIFAGIKYITAGGGKGVEEAQKILTYAIIGLVVVLLSFFIVGLVAGFTGVTCLLKFGINNC